MVLVGPHVPSKATLTIERKWLKAALVFHSGQKKTWQWDVHH